MAENDKKEKPVKHNYKEENAKLVEENKKLKEDALRALADSENYKKRIKEEAIKDRKYASIDLVSNLLNSIDMLDKAVNFNPSSDEMKNFLYGFKMISDNLMNTLIEDGLKKIEVKVGDEFDPNICQAMEKEHLDDFEPNKITKVLSCGYMYKDRIIKPAMVNVSE